MNDDDPGRLPGRDVGGGDLDPFLARPRSRPVLDPAFRPIVLARRLAEAAFREQGGVPVALAIEQPVGAIATRTAWAPADGHPLAGAALALLERTTKTLVWAYGGSRLHVDGPAWVVDALRRHYEEAPTGRFDAWIVSEAYGEALRVIATPRDRQPVTAAATGSVGRHLDGCRIGFDLGASDRKVAAVLDGRVVFSDETPWDPASHADPAWHAEQISDSLRRAAAHLPRVDAIGGSAAGVYVGNEVRVASLFRGVPRDAFETRVRGLFHELAAEWGVPFVVVNDGEVTALAGSMASGAGALLGIALGSSEAAGYVTREGHLTPWLNELAFVPIDAAPGAPVDEWSGDRGCGVQYLSQQAAARLLPVAGLDVPGAMPLPERLVTLQDRMAAGDDRARRVYETIGTYLGYALLEYATWYDLEHVLVLGRVTTGAGGEAIVAAAKAALAAEEGPGLTFHAVSERDKRHGQAVAAASLPDLAG